MKTSNQTIAELTDQGYKFTLVCPELNDLYHFINNDEVFKTIEEAEEEAEYQRNHYGREIEIYPLDEIESI